MDGRHNLLIYMLSRQSNFCLLFFPADFALIGEISVLPTVHAVFDLEDETVTIQMLLYHLIYIYILRNLYKHLPFQWQPVLAVASAKLPVSMAL